MGMEMEMEMKVGVGMRMMFDPQSRCGPQVLMYILDTVMNLLFNFLNVIA